MISSNPTMLICSGQHVPSTAMGESRSPPQALRRCSPIEATSLGAPETQFPEVQSLQAAALNFSASFANQCTAASFPSVLPWEADRSSQTQPPLPFPDCVQPSGVEDAHGDLGSSYQRVGSQKDCRVGQSTHIPLPLADPTRTCGLQGGADSGWVCLEQYVLLPDLGRWASIWTSGQVHATHGEGRSPRWGRELGSPGNGSPRFSRNLSGRTHN